MDGVETLIDDFNFGPIVVERRAAPTKDVYGAYNQGTITTFVVNPISWHEATGRDLDILPEADRNKEALQIYARLGSFPGTVGKGWRVSDQGFDADVCRIEGRKYRLVAAPRYAVQGKVWCAVGVLMEVQQS
jgi:hypothetical protein